MPILVGIDGTGGGFFPGDSFNNQYDVDFKKSFVRRICGDGSHNKAYFRGPVALGGGLPEAIEGGYNFIISKLQQAQFGVIQKPQFFGGSNPFNQQLGGTRTIPNNFNTKNEKVLLTGYSRGGLGVLVIAEKLRLQNIPVAAMVLFDAVDRHLAYDAPSIPENVAEVVHVMRHPSTDSRPSFGNCGTEYNSQKTKYTERKFMCTHGGMGGTPWVQGRNNSNAFIDEGKPDPPDGVTKVTYGQDQLVSPQVWNFVLPFLQGHGFV